MNGFTMQRATLGHSLIVVTETLLEMKKKKKKKKRKKSVTRSELMIPSVLTRRR